MLYVNRLNILLKEKNYTGLVSRCLLSSPKSQYKVI